MRGVVILSALSLLGLAVAPTSAQTSLVAELEVAARQYHKDPESLDRLKRKLEEAAEVPHPDTLVALARVQFNWGDVRAQNRGDKLEAYARGRDAAKRAMTLAPDSAAAHFWYAANTARWGQTEGVVQSLSLLGEVKREIARVMELDPKFVPVYALAGGVYYEVPGLLGGSLERAEELYRQGLALDPRSTGLRVGLAKTLIRFGRVDDARRELEAVLAETSASNPADWTVKDLPEARRLLDMLARSR
jgi:tetratricopeptide (TPR) repeat protein